MSKALIKLAVILTAFIIAAAAAFWLWPQNKDVSAVGAPFKVTRGQLNRLVVSTGTVTTQVGAQVKVGARVSGLVKKLLVAVGQNVKAGQVVARIEQKDLEAKMDQARAELAASQGRLERIRATGPREVALARAELNEVEIQLRQAEKDLQRQVELKEQELVAQESLDRVRRERGVLSARLAARQARSAQAGAQFAQDLKVAQAEVTSSQARLTTAEINLRYATVRAPISGVVSSVSTQEGETVTASLSAPTFITIVDLDRLQVDDFVDETDIGLIKEGQKAFFTIDAYPQRRFTGQVEAIHPTAKIIDDVVYYPVIIRIQGDSRRFLKPEMTASVSIVAASKQNALWVPERAVRRRGEKSLVLLKSVDGVKPHPVRTGWQENGRVEILAGLQEGQVVMLPASTRFSPPGRRPR